MSCGCDHLPLTEPAQPRRLKLETVTLCAVSSSNIEATVQALKASMAQVEFAQVLLFTHRDVGTGGNIRTIGIEEITSSQGYSDFLLNRLVDHVTTDHCLIVQWDGHVIDAGRWREAFLEYDYVGASWPQFSDDRKVGNGGFSLRSRRLMEACRHPDFKTHHPEDVAICRTNAELLQGIGMTFAPVAIADAFSAERAGDPTRSFGYHGVFLMPRVLGVERFWGLYTGLSDRRTVWTDFGALWRSVLRGKGGIGRAIKLAFDRMRDAIYPRA